MIVELKSIIFRKSRKELQRMINYKFPRFTNVQYTSLQKDIVMWGTTRWVHQTSKGKRDMRYGFNYRKAYPTTFIFNIGNKCYRIEQCNMNKAEHIAAFLQPIMDVPHYDYSLLSRCKNLFKQFNYNIENIEGYFDFKADDAYYVKVTEDVSNIPKLHTGCAVIVMEKLPYELPKGNFLLLDDSLIEASLNNRRLTFK